MPEARPSLAGLEPVEAAWRLVRLGGGACTLPEFRDAHAGDGSAEFLAERLVREGIQARPAVVRAGELAYLDLPTLVQLRDASWLILHERRRQRVRVEGSDGVRTMALAALAPELSGHVLDPSPALPAGKTLSSRLGALLARRRGAIAQVLAASALLQLLALALAEITGTVMDRALPDGARSMLLLAGTGVLLLASFQAATAWLRERALLYLIARVEVSAERGVLEHLLRLPFAFLEVKSLGERLQAVTGLASAREILAERALSAVLDGFLAVAYLAAMASKLGAPTVAVAAAALAMAGLTALVGRGQALAQALETGAQARQRSRLAETIAGVGTIKAAGTEGPALRRWLGPFAEELGHSLRRQRLGLWNEVGLEALRHGFTAVLLVWGGKLVLQGEVRVGTLFAFLQLSTGFLGAAIGLASAHALAAALRPQLAETREVLDRTPEKRVRRSGSTARARSVEMEDVWFRYTPDGPWILRGYTLRVEAGAKQLVAGRSGFGKSTILRLLGGLYLPERGSIRIGGTSPEAIRSEILYLPQLVRLHGGSLLDNLRMLSGGAPVERLLQAAEDTGLGRLVASLPMGYRTVLPHGGGSLSGGERQLVALTAAIASGRQVLLLDEALANVDALRAAAIHRRIQGLPATVVSAGHLA